MDLTGTVIGRYRIGRPIGAGGFSTVYEATDERFDGPVAVKVLAENHAFNPDIRERFVTEAMLQRRLAGLGVVPVFDLGETPSGRPFAVMPLATGGDLVARMHSWWNREGERPGILIDDGSLIRVAESLAQCLSALHADGIVHRDVKPGNLLLFGRATTGEQSTRSALAPGESILLSDLGFAKQLGDGSALTVAGGTPGFRPPEQERMGRVDGRSDIFGASAVLYWLITAAAPTRASETCRAALAERGASPELIRVLLTGLAPRSDDRHPTVETWFASIETMLEKRLLSPPPVHDANGPGPQPTGRAAATGASAEVGVANRSGLGAALAGLALGLLLAAMAAGGWWLADDGRSGSTDDAGSTVAEVLDDGRRRVSDQLDGLTVTVTGPDDIPVGAAATFTSEVSGATSFVWVAPDGNVHEGSDEFELTGSRVGSGRLSIVANDDRGRTLTVTTDFDVVDS